MGLRLFTFKVKCHVLLFVFCGAVLRVHATDGIRMGEWRVHLPYKNCYSMTVDQQNKIYVASTAGFFSYDPIENALEKLSTVSGFSDIDARVLNYDKVTGKLWIGYSGGRIDVLYKKKITPMHDLFRSPLFGDKTIYDISFKDRRAYVSSGLGIVVYHQDRMEVIENYLNLGITSNASSVPVYGTAISGDTIYAVTGNKMIYGIISPQINLSDFNNWSLQRLSTQSKHVVSFRGRLYAEMDSVIQVWDGREWRVLYGESFGEVRSMRVHNEHLVMVMQRLIVVIRPDGSIKEMVKNESNQGLVDQRNEFWHTTGLYGLVRLRPDSSEWFYSPNGPEFMTSYGFANYQQSFWVTAGGHNFEYVHTYNFGGYNVFKDNRWTPNPYFNSSLRALHDFTNVAVHPKENRMFIATHGKGVIEFEGDKPVEVYKHYNSSLKYFLNEPDNPGGSDSLYYTTGITFDPSGHLWVTNYAMDSALHVRTPDGRWRGIRLPTIYTGEIVVDRRGFKWIITPNPNFSNAALCVFDDNGTPMDLTDDRSVLLNSQNLDLPTNLIRSILVTRNNELWLGTEAGLVVIRNPGNVFRDFPGQSFGADRIIVEQGGSGAYLLGSEVIYCLTMDGGGRIWAGTNTGAWLIDRNGMDIIRHYNAQNSPLPSDNVYKIGIDQQSGEVFFGTDKGLFSVKEDATSPAGVMDKLKIYPNPVRPDFSGDISIEGLAFDSRVKITDITGRLVYQTVSNGGKAVWNGFTLKGERPMTGVYLVFAIDGSGQETAMGKILFVR
jgi:hypothetical protein